MKYMVRKKRLKESVPCARKETFCLRRKCRVLSNDLSISLSLLLSFCLSFPLSLSHSLTPLSLSLSISLSLSLCVSLSLTSCLCIFFPFHFRTSGRWGGDDCRDNAEPQVGTASPDCPLISHFLLFLSSFSYIISPLYLASLLHFPSILPICSFVICFFFTPSSVKEWYVELCTAFQVLFYSFSSR